MKTAHINLTLTFPKGSEEADYQNLVIDPRIYDLPAHCLDKLLKEIQLIQSLNAPKPQEEEHHW